MKRNTAGGLGAFIVAMISFAVSFTPEYQALDNEFPMLLLLQFIMSSVLGWFIGITVYKMRNDP